MKNDITGIIKLKRIMLNSQIRDLLDTRMKISDISVDISLIYPISVMLDTISMMTDISPIYRFWTDISWKYQIYDTRAC